MPEILYPGAEFGIPRLREDRQVRQVLIPCRAWGSVCRKSWQPGGFHFYVDDYKFLNLWRKPSSPLKAGAKWLTEPNYSLAEQTPEAVAVMATYRKRWLARYWQERGVPTVVDLNVSSVWRELNLTGVPRGWAAYSTRGQDAHLVSLDKELAVACEHSESERPLFLVIGNGRRTEQWCRDNGAVFLKYARGVNPDGLQVDPETTHTQLELALG